jgi:hypothetical protein
MWATRLPSRNIRTVLTAVARAVDLPCIWKRRAAEQDVNYGPRQADNIRFSNRPFGVKRFQTIHHSVDVARRLVLLFGIGAKAFPVWDSRTKWNNLCGGLIVRLTIGPSGQIDGQPLASHRDRNCVTSHSMRSQDQVGGAMQVGAGYRAAEVPNARWRRWQWCSAREQKRQLQAWPVHRGGGSNPPVATRGHPYALRAEKAHLMTIETTESSKQGKEFQHGTKRLADRSGRVPAIN